MLLSLQSGWTWKRWSVAALRRGERVFFLQKCWGLIVMWSQAFDLFLSILTHWHSQFFSSSFFHVCSVNNKQCHQNSRKPLGWVCTKLLAEASSCTCPGKEAVFAERGRSVFALQFLYGWWTFFKEFRKHSVEYIVAPAPGSTNVSDGG